MVLSGRAHPACIFPANFIHNWVAVFQCGLKYIQCMSSQGRSQEARANWEAALSSKDSAIQQLEEALASRQRAIEQLVAAVNAARDDQGSHRDRDQEVGMRSCHALLSPGA